MVFFGRRRRRGNKAPGGSPREPMSCPTRFKAETHLDAPLRCKCRLAVYALRLLIRAKKAVTRQGRTTLTTTRDVYLQVFDIICRPSLTFLRGRLIILFSDFIALRDVSRGGGCGRPAPMRRRFQWSLRSPWRGACTAQSKRRFFLPPSGAEAGQSPSPHRCA